MPIYTVKRDNADSDKEWDVNCSYEELKAMCEEYGLKHVMKPLKMIQGRGGALSKTDDGWKENLQRIKKGAGAGNTIKL